MTTYNSIFVYDSGLGVQREANCHLTVRPGMLLQENSDGEMQGHAITGGSHSSLFAVEDTLQGHGINDWYTVDTKIQYRHAMPGDRIWALLTHTITVAIGDYVESSGSQHPGLLKKSAEEADSSATTELTRTRNIVGRVVQAMASGDTSSDSTIANVYGGTRVLIEIV